MVDDENIDFSDIPELTHEQLKSMKRVGRPPFGDLAKQMIAIRLEPKIIEQLKDISEKKGIGYQTLIHQILEKYLARKKVG